MNAIEQMLEAGRSRIADRKRAEAEEQARADAERSRELDLQFALLMEAVARDLPAAFHGWIDDRRDQVESRSPTAHAVEVRIPDAAPIRAYFRVSEWVDSTARIGKWELIETPYWIPVYYRYHGTEEDGVTTARESEWARVSDASVAVALAYEAAEKREKLQAECDEINRFAAERRAAREASPAPTAEQTLIEALREWVLGIVPTPE